MRTANVYHFIARTVKSCDIYDRVVSLCEKIAEK